jgi:hypothetical protein
VTGELLRGWWWAYGEICDFYSVSPEYFVYNLVYGVTLCVSERSHCCCMESRSFHFGTDVAALFS